MSSAIGQSDLQPSTFTEMYWDIHIGQHGSVSINKYMMGVHASAERDRVQGAASQKGMTVDKNAFTRASMGKVTPTDCTHILNLALDTGVVAERELQAWADRNLGVDCTGFVVAYMSTVGRISINDYNGGCSCPFLATRAKSNKAPDTESALIWSVDDLRVGDMIMWMTDKSIETRKPGHIALVSYIGSDLIYFDESSGAADNYDHHGPRHNHATWNGESNQADGRAISFGTARVTFVRPPLAFG